MHSTAKQLASNPLRTRRDLQEAVLDLCTPLQPFFSPGLARLKLGQTGVVYSSQCAEMEAFARPLWGLTPIWAAGGETEFDACYLNGIRNGTDPTHSEYWGDIGDLDQRMVEMAALSVALALAPEKIWHSLTTREQQNLADWLGSINHHVVSDNNWMFFQVLVNVALKKLGAPYNQEGLAKALNRIEDFYLDEGWYRDGLTEQRDYYIPFAMHYYGLIYAQLMQEEDPDRSALFKARADRFARDFICWFGSDGAALPFGRSLTYRFAQCAFWGAMAFAGVQTFPLGVIKGIILRNLRWWFQHPIFTDVGILTVGYTYPNLLMAEGYNAPGSPNWAMKAFLPLALAADHPFWLAEELPLPTMAPRNTQMHPHMVICHDTNSQHVIAFTAGQTAGHAHSAAKYSKFAYSTLFAFSVPKGPCGLAEGAYDSMLALSEGDDLYRVRRQCADYQVSETAVYSHWLPWPDVHVFSWVLPGNPWHIRIHRIITQRALKTAEGGFAIRRDHNIRQLPAEAVQIESDRILVDMPWARSGIMNLSGHARAEMVWAEANTNLQHPATIIPTLCTDLLPGNHWLVSAVMGEHADQKAAWENPPQISVTNGVLKIFGRNETPIWEWAVS